MKKSMLADMSLFLITILWGSTFVLCKIVLDSTGTFNFLAIRFFMAFVILAAIFWKRLMSADKTTLKHGLIIGVVLFFAYATQTLGIFYTTASKAGFINGFSIVLVPIISALILKDSPKAENIIGIIMAIAGLAFLTSGTAGNLSVNVGDIIVFISTFGYALQILSVSHYSKLSDPIILSIIQVGVVSVLSAVFSLMFEAPAMPRGATVWTCIIIMAVFATALCFLVQNTMQKHTTPTRAALIYLGEPVFSAFFAFIILGEVLSGKGIIGCILIFAGMLVSELEFVAYIKQKINPIEYKRAS